MKFSITLEICMDFYMTFDYGKRQFYDVNTVKMSGGRHGGLCLE